MNNKQQNTSTQAFSLLELMAVVTIIGILASVAIPVMGKYLKKSKTGEASMNLRKIYDGEVAYYQEEITLANGTVAQKQFVQVAQTPSGLPGRDKRVGDWSTWEALKFSSDSPVLYVYETEITGVGVDSAFTARAQGDVDGDTSTSLFERVGSVDARGEITGGAAVFTLDELE